MNLGGDNSNVLAYDFGILGSQSAPSPRGKRKLTLGENIQDEIYLLQKRPGSPILFNPQYI